MSTYVLMKILESAPGKYDTGIRIITLGKLDKAYDRLAGYISSGDHVLDIGCGTGALTLRAARKGARVTGIDINPEMLDTARKRLSEAGLQDRVELREMGIAELGGEPSESYDVVMSGLCFSELTPDEVRFGLHEIHRILKPGGRLLLADEIVSRSPWKRILNGIARFFLSTITILMTQTTTRAVKDLPEKVREAGFHIKDMRTGRMDNFLELAAVKPAREDES